MPPKKANVPFMYQTYTKQCKRYSDSVDDVLKSENVHNVNALKLNLSVCKDKIQECYFDYSFYEEFDESVEFENLSQCLDIVDTSLAKIESFLSVIYDKLKFDSETKTSSATPLVNIKLPKYDLPTFSGQFEHWLSFKSIFLSSIDCNKSLSEIQKLQYLQSSVSNDALRLIRGFSITAENYKNAWDTLINRYDNNKELAFSQCRKIFSIKPVKATSESIRAMIDTCNEVLRNFKTLELESNQLVETLLIFTLQEKLEDSIKIKWELTLENRSFPSLENFLSFLEKQARSLQGIKISYNSHEKSTKQANKSITLKTSVKPNNDSCRLCHSYHPLHTCDKFLKMTTDERWNFIRNLKLCFNCLRTNHTVSSCKFTTSCRVCKQKHHTTLHNFQINQEHCNRNRSGLNQSAEQVPNQQLSNSDGLPLCLSGQTSNSNFILLSTALIKVKNSHGQFVDCRVLLDSGSQTSLISESCSKRLNLQFKDSEYTIFGLDERVAARSTKTVDLQFTPHYNQDMFFVKALVVKKLTSDLPNFYISEFNWPHLKGLQLADPEFHVRRSIDIIFGADIFLDLIQNGKICGSHDQPSAINSKLGWLLSGRVSTTNRMQSQNASLINCHALMDLENLVKRFWEVESVPMANQFSNEEQEVEDFFFSHTKRDEEGRFVVKLPFKDGPVLGNSRNQATKRFLSLERKLQQNPELKSQYCQFMKEYQDLNHMQLVPESASSEPPSQCFYLPHFAVIREQSETTKLRVVFDASAKSESGVSLNDILHTGPKLQNELFNVLIKFRTHSVALTGDIEKMFRQIRVDQSDSNFQRILWRENPEDPLLEYRLLTVTYGTACAPYLAIRTLKELAMREAENFPRASEVVLNEFYVDDSLTGANTCSEAKQLLKEIIELMKKGGFPIRKWASNEASVIESLPEELRSSSSSLKIEEDQVHKILGIIWDSREDTFKIEIHPPVEGILTKRQLLSNIAKIYDPLGLLSPTIIQLKILMQDLWKESIGWDDPLPHEISKRWNQFKSEMDDLAQIKIRRFLMKDSSIKNIQLIGFCDASQRAYAGVFYLKTHFNNGSTHVSIIASKTRVAPVKQITLPRLELSAALLMSQLYPVVLDSLKPTIHIGKTVLYSDSQIVLDWLNASPQRFKTFVANRIVKIQELTADTEWRHVKSNDNPADCASRGISASKLKNHSLWWHGPQWLCEDKILENPLPQNPPAYHEVEFEEKKVSVHIATSDESSNNSVSETIEKYSSFTKLIRVISFCLRFINNCKSSKCDRINGALLSNELDAATQTVIKIVQECEFKQELNFLKKNVPFPKSNKYLPLNIFLDSNDIIRVGGRLKNSNLDHDQKHQILLPKKSHFTTILVQYFHSKNLHSGPQLTLSCIRQRFWIPSGRDVVRRILSACLTCFRLKSRPSTQLMGNLPSNRFQAGRAFRNVGIDFGGPFLTKPNLPRSKVRIKSYIALFICFATKAVHLEVVSELTTDAFLAALRRFISRRGKPSDIHSDNGTNFKGAAAYLKDQAKLINSTEVQSFVAEESIVWHFIPPAAPHFGGLWEAGIKSTKHHLIKICKTAVLNFEELSTLVIQIEACLNSRPLTPMSSDPHDLEPLTPGHFLIGAPLTSPPEQAPTKSICLKSRWHLVQQLRNQFWARWRKEYLNNLQQRGKWTMCQNDVQVDDLVLLKDDSLPPMRWSLGRVTRVFPGDDGRVRVVEVKTSTGQFRRPIARCCPLPKPSS